MKPRIFIGSSTEALDVAYGIQENLEHDALCKVWTQGIFELSGRALDNLLKAAQESDFAIFVFQADDITKIRDQSHGTVRDNVVFEFGLFVGRLGKEKVYFLVPRGSGDTHLPTDLLGVTAGQYTPPANHCDLAAALGPFCTKVRRQIKSLQETPGKPPADSLQTPAENPEPGSLATTIEAGVVANPESIENGITVDDFGNFKISIAPTVFFANRAGDSFPGVRGLEWFGTPREALDRLEILLRVPIVFEKAVGHGTDPNPIWMWRGGHSREVDLFQRLTETRCLLNAFEFEMERIAAFRLGSYAYDFVYVEVRADQPIGIYDNSDISERVAVIGYASEEYGLYKGIPITRACYDDGAAIIDGKVVDVSGAKLRVRFLTNYNFLLASKYSPINSHEFDRVSKPLLNEMLQGNAKIDELCRTIAQLPRLRQDS